MQGKGRGLSRFPARKFRRCASARPPRQGGVLQHAPRSWMIGWLVGIAELEFDRLQSRRSHRLDLRLGLRTFPGIFDLPVDDRQMLPEERNLLGRHPLRRRQPFSHVSGGTCFWKQNERLDYTSRRNSRSGECPRIFRILRSSRFRLNPRRGSLPMATHADEPSNIPTASALIAAAADLWILMRQEPRREFSCDGWLRGHRISGPVLVNQAVLAAVVKYRAAEIAESCEVLAVGHLLTKFGQRTRTAPINRHVCKPTPILLAEYLATGESERHHARS